jgi:bacterioferritin (cytochrome b1)
MQNEFLDVLDSAIYKEIASEAFYLAMQNKTQDPGAQSLMREMAEEEKKHSQWIKALKDKKTLGLSTRGSVPNLKISDYLTTPETPAGSNLQDTLIYAMKREQQSLEFYSNLMASLRTAAAKRLCVRLVNQELRHKLKLETLYDNMFLGED